MKQLAPFVLWSILGFSYVHALKAFAEPRGSEGLPQGPRLIVVLAGGFMSHFAKSVPRMQERLKPLTDESRNRYQLPTAYLHATFSGSMQNPDEREDLFYKWVTPSGSQGVAQIISPNDLVRKLDREAERYPETYAIVIGHSHGGWLAMKIAAETKHLRILRLVTFDPISYLKCRPRDLATALVEALRDPSSFGGGGFANESPADLRDQHRRIRSRVSVWNHFWQKQFGALHSGDITEASTRKRCGYPNGESYPHNAHEAIREDAENWKPILSGVRNDVLTLARKQQNSKR